MEQDGRDHHQPDGPEEGRERMQANGIGVQPAHVNSGVPQNVDNDEQDHELARDGHEEFSGDCVCG